VLLDKPGGLSSNAALQSVRRLYSAAKAGHTGTLDPLASGLLPLCFGEATKFSVDLLDADKTYEAEVQFGVTTDTGDAEGEVVERRPVSVDRSGLETVLARFRGRQQQVPPMFSALKHHGQPLYALARQGIVVDRQPREITIHELVLLDLSGDRCRLRVTCSKGTYIRTLAEDLGWALACGAHLLALRRTAVAALSVEMAVTFDRLATLSDDERLAHLHAPDMLLLSLPAVVLPADLTQRFRHGNPVPSAGELGKYRVYCSLGHLLGVGERDPSGILRPRRLISST